MPRATRRHKARARRRRKARARRRSRARARKWEDLEFDCLLNIFGRVGMDSLLFDVPFVCKSWYRASLDPSCWEHIDKLAWRIRRRERQLRGPSKASISFSELNRRFTETYNIKQFSINRFMNLIVSRGFSKSAFLDLSDRNDEKYLQHLIEKCPGLKSLSLGFYTAKIVSKMVGKWKELEEVRLEATMEIDMFEEILDQIALHCKEFNSLIVSEGCFCEQHALSIVLHLPNIKKLRIKLCYLEQEVLEVILRGCKELECLDVSKCGHVRREWDAEKLKQLASHISTSNLATFPCFGYCWFSEIDVANSDSGDESDSDNFNGGSCDSGKEDLSAYECDYY